MIIHFRARFLCFRVFLRRRVTAPAFDLVRLVLVGITAGLVIVIAKSDSSFVDILTAPLVIMYTIRPAAPNLADEAASPDKPG